MTALSMWYLPYLTLFNPLKFSVEESFLDIYSKLTVTVA